MVTINNRILEKKAELARMRKNISAELIGYYVQHRFLGVLYLSNVNVFITQKLTSVSSA